MSSSDFLSSLVEADPPAPIDILLVELPPLPLRPVFLTDDPRAVFFFCLPVLLPPDAGTRIVIPGGVSGAVSSSLISSPSGLLFLFWPFFCFSGVMYSLKRRIRGVDDLADCPAPAEKNAFVSWLTVSLAIVLTSSSGSTPTIAMFSIVVLSTSTTPRPPPPTIAAPLTLSCSISMSPLPLAMTRPEPAPPTPAVGRVLDCAKEYP
mmetsp:Transcript_3799/g.9075  ORF Transcript_3799/g.9075 Transcript_3799/m.9075 type:complete len:206 (-) Transcript_3799:705-1322(-)